MDIDVTQASGVTVVAPQGDLDMATVDEVRRTLAGLIDGGQSRVLMDLGGVGYIDSSGMGAMVAAMKQARAAGATDAECTISEGDEFSANVRMREVESLKEAGSRGAGLRHAKCFSRCFPQISSASSSGLRYSPFPADRVNSEEAQV